jgi:hypothetical protein
MFGRTETKLLFILMMIIIPHISCKENNEEEKNKKAQFKFIPPAGKPAELQFASPKAIKLISSLIRFPQTHDVIQKANFWAFFLSSSTSPCITETETEIFPISYPLTFPSSSSSSSCNQQGSFPLKSDGNFFSAQFENCKNLCKSFFGETVTVQINGSLQINSEKISTQNFEIKINSRFLKYSASLSGDIQIIYSNLDPFCQSPKSISSISNAIFEEKKETKRISEDYFILFSLEEKSNFSYGEGCRVASYQRSFSGKIQGESKFLYSKFSAEFFDFKIKVVSTGWGRTVSFSGWIILDGSDALFLSSENLLFFGFCPFEGKVRAHVLDKEFEISFSNGLDQFGKSCFDY